MKTLKTLHMESDDLSDKVVEIGQTRFKLWLEFEVSSPWDEPENDFANIGGHPGWKNIMGLTCGHLNSLKR